MSLKTQEAGCKALLGTVDYIITDIIIDSRLQWIF